MHNDGKILHEFSIGNATVQMEHAQMIKMGARIDPNTASPEPGESATLAWRWQGADTVVFACNVPGHF